jgi:hypothetical protein
MGALAAGGVGYLAQRMTARRDRRAALLCGEMRQLLNWVEGHIHSLEQGHGPFELYEGASTIADMQRIAVAVGSRDLRAIRGLSRAANGLIDINHQTWLFLPEGRNPKKDPETSIAEQLHCLRMLRRGAYSYEHWLRKRLSWRGTRGMSDVDGPFTYPHERPA